MNKTISLAAITFVAIVMGMSAVVPSITFAYAANEGNSCVAAFFDRVLANTPEREAQDHNDNGWVCETLPGRNGQGPPVIIDDSIKS